PIKQVCPVQVVFRHLRGDGECSIDRTERILWSPTSICASERRRSDITSSGLLTTVSLISSRAKSNLPVLSRISAACTALQQSFGPNDKACRARETASSC